MGSEISEEEKRGMILRLAKVPRKLRKNYIHQVIENLPETCDKSEVRRNLKKMFFRIDLMKVICFPAIIKKV